MNVIFVVFLFHVFCSTNALVKTLGDLSDHLASKHSTTRFPQDKIVVNVGAGIYQLVEVNGAAQEFTVLLWMQFSWKDSTLSWEKTNYNFTFGWLPSNSVWKPDIVVFNILRFEDLMKSSTPYVKIGYDGTVYHSFPMIYTASCSLDIRMFPFDKQKCELKLGSWVIDASVLDMVTAQPELNTDSFVTDNQWTLEKTNANRFVTNYMDLKTMTYQKFVSVHFVFHLNRLPMYYVFNLIIPVLIITAVSLLGIFMPSSADGVRIEKVTMGLTAMLTMAVFLLMVSDQTPKDSRNMPLLSVYIMLDIILVTFATIVSICIMKLQVRDLRKIPVPLRWEKYLAKISKPIREKIGKSGQKSKPSSIHKVRPIDGNYEEDIELEKEVVSQVPQENSNLTWQDVCIALDKLFLLIHFAIFGLITFIMIFILPLVN